MMLSRLPTTSITASAPERLAQPNPLLFLPKCKTKRIAVQNAHLNGGYVVEKARWRSGDAADCKSAVAPHKITPIFTIHCPFAERLSAGCSPALQNARSIAATLPTPETRNA